MMLITEEYREQNKQLHAKSEHYGTSGNMWAPVVRQLSESGRLPILDYGCGKGTLKTALGLAYKVTEYDPAIEGKDTPPEPHPVVVCSDVLEHIEPECLEAVIDDLARVTTETSLFVVHTGPALKTLPDGRNAHLIQQGPTFWLPLILRRFEPLRMEWVEGKVLWSINRPLKS